MAGFEYCRFVRYFRLSEGRINPFPSPLKDGQAISELEGRGLGVDSVPGLAVRDGLGLP